MVGPDARLTRASRCRRVPDAAPRDDASYAGTRAALVAAIPVGYEIVRAMADSDGVGPFIGATFGGGGMAAGATFILGGITGLVLDGLDYTPTH